MAYYFTFFAVSLLVSIIIVPLLRQTALNGNTLDQPSERKIHKTAIPRLGGIAIAISFFFSLGVGYAFLTDNAKYLENIIGICIGASIITFVGIWDDVRGLNASKKFLGQFAAVLATLPFGFIIKELNIPFFGVVYINSLVGFLLITFWMLGIMNAINLIDGIDGLAAGISIKILSVLFIISLLTGEIQMALVCITLIGAVAGFLRYNFPPAKIFMGDCGALMLGFIMSVVTAKVIFQNSGINSSSVVPVLLFGLPILDTTWAIIRRLLKHRKPFTADLGHLHHRLLNLGMTQRKAVLTLYLINLLAVGSGILVFILNNNWVALFICVFMMIIGIIMVIALGRMSPQNGYDSNQYKEYEAKTNNISPENL